MKKEELIKLIETLEIEEVKSLELVYYKEICYGPYDNRNTNVLKVLDNEKDMEK